MPCASLPPGSELLHDLTPAPANSIPVLRSISAHDPSQGTAGTITYNHRHSAASSSVPDPSRHSSTGISHHISINPHGASHTAMGPSTARTSRSVSCPTATPHAPHQGSAWCYPGAPTQPSPAEDAQQAPPPPPPLLLGATRWPVVCELRLSVFDAELEQWTLIYPQVRPMRCLAMQCM